jgi:hypothetical protein
MVKKITLALVILFSTLLLALIVLPFAFRGRIAEKVKQEASEQVDARVEMGRLRLSLIRQFPNVSLQIHDIRIIGNEPFETDTLADIGRLSVSFDLRSLLRGGDYEIGSIRLDDAGMLFKLLEDGRANYNIFPGMSSDGEEDALPDTLAAASDFRLVLREVDIRNGRVVYHDDKWLTYIEAGGINGVLTGDFRAGMQTTFEAREAVVDRFSLRYDTWPILSRARVVLSTVMDADLDRFVFRFNGAELLVNELPLVFDGMVGWPVDDLEMDFTFGAARSDFGSFLSLLPALYTDDFKDLESSGTLQLEGFVKGPFAGKVYPAFGLTLAVDNGMFRYPGLPASVDGVQVRAGISNPGPDLDLTVVEVPELAMNLGGNPVEARFRLATPMSDPRVEARLLGSIDLGRVKDYYPLEENTSLAGEVSGDVELRGRLSAIETGNYDAFHAVGSLSASGVEVALPGMDHRLEVATASFRFSPQSVRLEEFASRYGGSDLAATGQIDNLLGYLFDGQALSGAFSTRSGMLDLNELMEAMPETEEPEEPMELSVIRIPANIDFNLDATAGRVVFGKLDIRDLSGRIRLADQQASMDGLRMNLLGGALELSGLYDVREALPRVSFGLDVRGFDIGETFNAFNTVRILAPVAEYARGGVSLNLQLDALLDEGLSPVLESLRGSGGLRSSAVRLQNTPTLSALSDELKINELRDLSLRDLRLAFSFAEGKLELPPVGLQLGELRARVSGVTYFDQRLSYEMNFEIPRSWFGQEANQVLEGLVAEAAGLGVQFSPGERVPVDVLVGGTFRQPELSVSLAALRGRMEQQLREEASRLLRETEDRMRQEAEQARQQLQEEAEQRVEDVREQVDEEVEARVARIMEEAGRQAARVRLQAANTAESIRREAREQGQRLEREAQGPIAQAAARRTAQALISEADRRAAQIEQEAERNAERLLEEARQQAERIRRGED